MTRHHVRRPWWHYLFIVPLLRPAPEPEPFDVVQTSPFATRQASQRIRQDPTWGEWTREWPQVSNQGPFLQPGQTARSNTAAGRF